MPYLIDGHNLIPKIPGLSLRTVDDEIQLIELLQEFCRNQRRQVEVYFDNAPPGQAGTHRYGQVTAHFVRQGSTADAAIRQRLGRLGKGAANWSVVSSDRAVQSAARSMYAQALSSEDFVHLLLQTRQQSPSVQDHQPPDPNPDEVDEWLKIFGQGNQPGKK